MLTKRKGITPVIAIVLLLLITVGAVGVVYTQFQSLLGNPGEQVDQQQQVRQTEIRFDSAYKAQDASGEYYVNLTVTNVGAVAWNTSDFTLSYVPEGTGSAVSGQALQATKFSYNETSDNCFSEDNSSQLVDPENGYTCNTGVKWPSATTTIGFSISMNSASKSWGVYTCTPSTTSSVGC
ncbi:archaellin/type IV pilin N-terminal domain-containing protein [Candidatus Nanohalovita haloferacivicina]|uniref:archaellin/type IV pilin N-terminal domain-containing protein n=1 Tax=Candidatus Nanohalovita haloferacivicina TaxID=2978046 RepID=UPI00325FDA5F|nr:hypothetical protein HBNXNv_0382 [Candidatus Nanohalobia archaeon BNXNv]